MLQPHEYDLLQRSAEGDLSPAERAELEALLAQSEDARQVAAILSALDHDDESSIEPAADAVPSIMAAITALPPHRQHLSLAWSNEQVRHADRPVAATSASSSFPRRSVLAWGLSAAAAVVLAGLWMAGALQQSPSGVDATMGAAPRTQPSSGSGASSPANDAALRFLQSDELGRLLQDPAARRTLAHAELRPLLASAEVREAIREEGFADLVLVTAQDPALADLANGSDSNAAPRDPNVDAALARARVRAALTRPALRALLASREYRFALRSSNLRALLAGEDAQSMLRSEAFATAARHDGFAAALSHPDFAAALDRAH